MSLTMIHAQLCAHTKQAPKNTSAPPKKKNTQQVFDLDVIARGGGGEVGCTERQRGGDNQVGVIPSHPLALVPAQLGLCLQVPYHRWQPSPQFPHPRRHLIFPGDKRGLGEQGWNRVFHFFPAEKKKPSCIVRAHFFADASAAKTRM